MRVELSSDTLLAQIPEIVKEMILRGERVRHWKKIDIHILPIAAGEVRPDRTMSVASDQFWEWAIGFREWAEWHYILPHAEVRLSNLSNTIVDAVRNLTLVCVRARDLSHNTQDLRSALKDACRRQFREHRPGALHLLVNTELYGLGANTEIAAIERDVAREVDQVFRDYTRLWRVSVDLVAPPRWGTYRVEARRATFLNPRCQGAPTIGSPSDEVIVLW